MARRTRWATSPDRFLLGHRQRCVHRVQPVRDRGVRNRYQTATGDNSSGCSADDPEDAAETSSSSFLTVCSVQAVLPNGAPRWLHRRTASSSAIVSGVFTKFSQSEGYGTGQGERLGRPLCYVATSLPQTSPRPVLANGQSGTQSVSLHVPADGQEALFRLNRKRFERPW